MGIPYYSRKTGRIEEEKVLGELLVKLAYQPSTLWFTDHILTKKFFSDAAGWIQNQPFSAKRISKFVKEYGIDLSEFEPIPYQSFNEFFIRKFRTGARTFSTDPNAFPAFAEARYLAKENISLNSNFKVKDARINLTQLLGDSDLASQFDGGTLVIARLCPVDYHRFHFPVDCEIIRHFKIEGAYHSVNPEALRARPDLFLHNERHVTTLRSDVFGHFAFIEVGAFGVGKIIQTHDLIAPAKRGEEKGYFLFGGSTVIAVFEKNKLKLAEDLLNYSAQGLETWIPLGGELGHVVE